MTDASCKPGEHDFHPPVVLTASGSKGSWFFRTVGQISSLTSVCRKCGKTIERVLNIEGIA